MSDVALSLQHPNHDLCGSEFETPQAPSESFANHAGGLCSSESADPSLALAAHSPSCPLCCVCDDTRKMLSPVLVQARDKVAVPNLAKGPLPWLDKASIRVISP